MHDAITSLKFSIALHLTAFFIFRRNLLKNMDYRLGSHYCDVCGDIELARTKINDLRPSCMTIL